LQNQNLLVSCWFARLYTQAHTHTRAHTMLCK